MMANLKENKALQLLGIMDTAPKKNKFATENDEYYENAEDINDTALGLPAPNSYIDTYMNNNSALLQPEPDNILYSSSAPIPPTPPKPPPPPQSSRPQSSAPPQPPNTFNISSNGYHNHDDDDKKELGTSEDYINKQLQRVMDGLNIPKHARPAMLALSKPQKLTMIQQYNRKQNGSELPNVTNVKRQNQPKPTGPHTNSKLIPIMGKNISAPILTSGIAPIGTIPISEARQRQKQKLQRSKTPNSLNIHQKRNSDIISAKNGSYLRPKTNNKQRHQKSKSNINLSSYKPPPVPLDALKPSKSSQSDNNNNNSNDGRLSLPPPVPVSIKKKYGNKPGTDSNRSSIKSFESEDEVPGINKMDLLIEEDDEYEYYEEDEEPPEPTKPNNPKPPSPVPLKTGKKKKKTKNIKVKLRIGSEIEVYSNSKQRWIDGNIVKIKGKLICVAYGPNDGTQKWLEATSKNFRPKIGNIKKANLSSQRSAANISSSLPSLDACRTSDASAHEAKIDDDVDHMNNPTPQRFRKSVAFQQKKQVKIKLRIGSPVEVFSVSKNQWIDGKLTGIKKDLIRVAYGKGLTTEKWLRANSKQFRPKLDMVDAAMHEKKNGLHNNNNNNNNKKKNNNHHNNIKKKGKNGSMHHSKYSIDSDDESDVGTHNVQPMFIPQHGPNDNNNNKNMNEHRKPPPVPPQHINGGAYVTHSLRREQYQQFSVESIKGTNNKRGDLKIKVHGALQLRHNGNFASIKVAEHTLRTKKVTSDENPVWKEILTFSNFRPHIGKTGIITIYNKAAIMGEKIIGSAEFELPIVFNRQEKMTIDIADNKNKLSGIVVLEQCVVDIGR